MTEIRIVEALSSFSVNLEGAPFSVSAGELFLATDQVVKGREALFGELTVRSSGAPRQTTTHTTVAAVETASAAPGERRVASRVKKGGDGDA